jgi:hypothetical protein
LVKVPMVNLLSIVVKLSPPEIRDIAHKTC